MEKDVAIVYQEANHWKFRINGVAFPEAFATQQKAIDEAQKLGYKVKCVKIEGFKTTHTKGSRFNLKTVSNQNQRLFF